MEAIVMEQLCKSYGDKRVLRDFSAVLVPGKTTSLMAPSGAGNVSLYKISTGGSEKMPRQAFSKVSSEMFSTS